MNQSKERFKYFFAKFSFWIIPFIIIGTDIALRLKVLLGFTRLETVFYFVSIIFSFLLYKAIFTLLHTLRHNKLTFFRNIYILILILVSAVYTFILAGSYGYYLKMGVMPNYFTFEFIKMETHNSLTILRDSLSLLNLILISAIYAICAISLHVASTPDKRPYKWPFSVRILHLIIIICLTFIINNNVRFVDQCFVSDTNMVGFVGRNLYNKIFKLSIHSTGLQARNRIIIKEKYPNPGYNIILIISESLRSRNMGLYGYNRPTTPFLSRLEQEHKQETFVFKKHLTNSTATLLSFPSILNGVSPAQPPGLFHSSPLIFEYAKAAGYKNFLISSQDFNFYNFRSFFRSNDIDCFWDKEKSGLPAVNDLGIEDSSTAIRAIQEIDKNAGKGEPFMGVIQFNTNHYPYHTPDTYKHWKGRPMDDYDNTILYQDSLLARIFNHLEKIKITDKTIVMFVSDHGEAFGEHGFIGHRGYYYLELLQIPFIIFIPETLQQGFDIKRLRANCEINTNSIDITPTLLDIMRIKNYPFIEGLCQQLMGTSLLKDIDPERDILTINNNAIARYQEGVSFIKGNLHYMYQLNHRPIEDELYDINSDPDEKHNLWGLTSKALKDSCLSVFKPFAILNDLIIH